MQGLLELGRLKQLVEAGEIDTVVVAFPDMQGRLMGNKVVEHYLHAGTWEQTEYDRRVTDWEVIRNFERA